MHSSNSWPQDEATATHRLLLILNADHDGGIGAVAKRSGLRYAKRDELESSRQPLRGTHIDAAGPYGSPNNPQPEPVTVIINN